MIPLPRSSSVLILVSAFALTISTGCSQQSKLDRHIANAQRYMAEGRYDAAEIEFINAQRIDPRNAKALAGLGSLYFEQGSLTKAAPRLLTARELAPDDLDARIRLARTYLTIGVTAEARKEALFILGRRANDAEALQLLAETSTTPEQIAETRSRIHGEDALSHTALAMLYLRERNTAEATSHAERALAADPKFAPAHSLMASLHLMRRDLEAAQVSLKSAADLSGPRSPRRIAYAGFLLGRGNSAAGREALEGILKEAPDFLPASIMLADAAAASGDHAGAQKLLDGVMARDPDHPEAAMLRARIHLARGENTTAIQQLEKLVTKYPDAAPMHHLLATAYLATNDVNRANASLARTLQLAPEHTDAVMLRAALQLRGGDPAAAVLALRELVKKHPEIGRARVLLADALRARGQADEALAIYREAIDAAPEDPQLRFFAGGLFVQVGRVAEAREAFERALALRPDFTAAVEQLVALDLAAKDLPAAARRAEEFAAAHATSAEAHVLLAKVAVAQGNTDRAETSLRRAIEANPESATAYMLLAQLYLSSKRQDEALINLQAATAKNPRDISALMLIGILQQGKGELQAARTAYEKLLEANPRFVPALNNLAYLCSENFGELDRAYELANRAREIRPNDPIALDTFGWILFQRRDFAWASSVLSESVSKLSSNPEVQYHFGMTRYMLGDEAGARVALSTAVDVGTDFPGKDNAVAHLAILNLDPDSADDSALKTVRERLVKAPDDPVALVRIAAIHARRGEPDQALAAYESALKSTPNNTTAIVSLARFHASQPNGLSKGFELAKSAYKLAPEDPAVLHTLGRLAFDSDDHAWAASLLSEAARRAPGAGAVQFDFAEAAYAVGRVNDALTAMRAAIQSNIAAPRAEAARQFVNLVEATSSATLSAEAQTTAAAVLEKTPNSVPALMVSATALEQSGNAADAAAVYHKVIRILPRFAPAHKRLAILLARENPPASNAQETAAKARELLPNDTEVAGALGTIHFRRSEFPRAATLLGEAARASSATPEIHYMLGIALRQLGETNPSRASLQRALDLGLTGDAAAEARAALAAP